MERGIAEERGEIVEKVRDLMKKLVGWEGESAQRIMDRVLKRRKEDGLTRHPVHLTTLPSISYPMLHLNSRA